MTAMNWSRYQTKAQRLGYSDEKNVTHASYKTLKKKARRVNFTRRLTREEELQQIAAFTPKPRP
jgi:type IV secretory pathway component VirB8